MRWDGAGRVVRPFTTFASGIVLVAILLSLLGYPLDDVLSALATGSMGSESALQTSLGFAMPLLLIALGVTVSFRAGIFNLGAQGQFYVGALCSIVVGLALGDWPKFVVVPIAIVAGAVSGAVWSLACGIMLNLWHANEILTTLMANFVAAGLLAWAAAGPLHDSTEPSAISGRLNPTLRLSDSTGWSLSIVVVVAVVAALTWILISRTPFGIQADFLGQNHVAARWMGVPIGRLRLSVFGIAGAASGLAGTVVVFGSSGTVSAGMSPNIGFTAVLVAALGLLTVQGTAIAAVVFGGLSAAVVYLPLATEVPASAVAVFQGTVMVLVTCRVVLPASGIRRTRARSAGTGQGVEPRASVIASSEANSPSREV